MKEDISLLLPNNPYSEPRIPLYLFKPSREQSEKTEAARFAYARAQQDMLKAGYELPNYWDNRSRTGDV